MGMAKRYMEEIEACGWSDVCTAVCTKCVVDPALAAAIRKYGGSDTCDYCEETPANFDASAPFGVLLELVVNGPQFEYEEPVEHMA